jgi:pimeloyl-ACP methyl ester carboxylesterase
MLIPSSDGVQVAVHDLGGTGRPLLLSHATGFHGHCYLPMAKALAAEFHSYALDYRGHGLTPVPEQDLDQPVDWERYGDDALAAARAVAPEGGLIAFGHSMGGAGLLMAAHRDPGLFEVILAFEPIVFPPPDPAQPQTSTPLVAGARRRRATFDSVEQAIANYSSKPPMAAFTPEALRCYVEHGFMPSQQDQSITLRCAPEHEARTFESGGLHRTWEVLHEISTRVIVVAGANDGMGPAMIAEGIAGQLPNSEYTVLARLDHFGPMTHPAEVAKLVAAAARG